jgi:hypothetical protein
MLPLSASDLRAAPRLRHIYIKNVPYGQSTPDAFEKMALAKSTNAPSGIVRSYRNGDDEVLVTRQLSRYIETSDVLAEPFPYPEEFDQSRYTGADGRQREKDFEHRDTPSWVIYTDLAGVSVPLEVIENMRIAQGATLEEWDGRNVEVTDAAWSLLEAWRPTPKQPEEVEDTSEHSSDPWDWCESLSYTLQVICGTKADDTQSTSRDVPVLQKLHSKGSSPNSRLDILLVHPPIALCGEFLIQLSFL